MAMAPELGLAPIALKTVMRLLDELVVSYTIEFTTTQVKPFPVAVGWFGSAVIPVREETERSCSLFDDGETEAVEAVLLPSVSLPEVKLVADIAI